MLNKKAHSPNVVKRIGQVLLIALITLVLLELVLGGVFYFKDRKLIEAEVNDYPYFYFQLKSETGLRNQDGFKTAYARQKPDSVIRIVISGGSVAYGSEPENSIAAYLEKSLQSKYPDKKFQVINAGVPAFVIEQEFILIQLVLQYYKPDIIISVDGYNDLLTCDINRYYPCSDVLPPHNWNDFMSINYNSTKNSLSSRFFGMFTNIGRLVDYVKRKTADEEMLYNALSANSKKIAQTYANRMLDIHDFCAAKGIAYYHCLQPVNWPLHDTDNPSRNKSLKTLYTDIVLQIDTVSYVIDLSALFIQNPKIFTDECHVTNEGNKLFAEAIMAQLPIALKGP